MLASILSTPKRSLTMITKIGSFCITSNCTIAAVDNALKPHRKRLQACLAKISASAIMPLMHVSLQACRSLHPCAQFSPGKDVSCVMRQVAGSAPGSKCDTHSRSLTSSSSLARIFSLSQSLMAKSSHTWYLPSPCSRCAIASDSVQAAVQDYASVLHSLE